MRRIGRYRVAMLATLLFALTGCNVPIGIAQPQATVISITSNDPQSQRFVDTIAAGTLLNSGISLQLLGAVRGVAASGATIGILILNLSDEPVSFPNQSFGLRAYTFDVKTNDWFQQQFLYSLAPAQKTIPANLRKYDPAVNNLWYLDARPFGSVNLPQFRLYVEGTGTMTAQKYGAYVDVTLK